MLKAYIRARPKTSALDDSLPRRGWQESELATRRRSDPGKLPIAARLRNETTLPIKWIAARVQIGTAKGAKSVLRFQLSWVPIPPSSRNPPTRPTVAI
jgi:hypothetical protein